MKCFSSDRVWKCSSSDRVSLVVPDPSCTSQAPRLPRPPRSPRPGPPGSRRRPPRVPTSAPPSALLQPLSPGAAAGCRASAGPAVTCPARGVWACKEVCLAEPACGGVPSSWSPFLTKKCFRSSAGPTRPHLPEPGESRAGRAGLPLLLAVPRRCRLSCPGRAASSFWGTSSARRGRRPVLPLGPARPGPPQSTPLTAPVRPELGGRGRERRAGGQTRGRGAPPSRGAPRAGHRAARGPKVGLPTPRLAQDPGALAPSLQCNCRGRESSVDGVCTVVRRPVSRGGPADPGTRGPGQSPKR
ncbi:translation initiation factor IF-2-like isoform X2 [Nycticebus coucang]|uniref:translation initiation factor IF-2-like isoform X2 n=1 Tax=Nycticebus coucang TaxID=9470 RepID=UPI00234D601C|nr:translation initiation factor IF-2-like isoform X2 [Nycticebus coucang]